MSTGRGTTRCRSPTSRAASSTSASRRSSRQRMAHISVRQISKDFVDPAGHTTRVLRSLSLDVLDGEFLTLLGPSGCGKSTLIRIVAGLEPQTAGSIAIDGVAVDRLLPKQRNVAMVFQSYALYPHMTVA